MAFQGRGQSLNQLLDSSVPVAAHTATANGAAVKTGADGDARAALVLIGTWTDGTHTITWEESDDGSGWTEIVLAGIHDPFGVLAGATNTVVISDDTRADTILQLDLLTTREYVRSVTTIAGATTGAIYSAPIMTGQLRVFGLNNPATPAGIAVP